MEEGLQLMQLDRSCVGGHSSPSGYQMSKTGCGINGNQALFVFSISILQHHRGVVHGCICRCNHINEIPRATPSFLARSDPSLSLL